MFGRGKSSVPVTNLVRPQSAPAVEMGEDGVPITADAERVAIVDSYAKGMAFVYGHGTPVARAIMVPNWSALRMGERIISILNQPTPAEGPQLEDPVLPEALGELGSLTQVILKWEPHSEAGDVVQVSTGDQAFNVQASSSAESLGVRVEALLRSPSLVDASTIPGLDGGQESGSHSSDPAGSSGFSAPMDTPASGSPLGAALSAPVSEHQSFAPTAPSRAAVPSTSNSPEARVAVVGAELHVFRGDNPTSPVAAIQMGASEAELGAAVMEALTRVSISN